MNMSSSLDPQVVGTTPQTCYGPPGFLTPKVQIRLEVEFVFEAFIGPELGPGVLLFPPSFLLTLLGCVGYLTRNSFSELTVKSTSRRPRVRSRLSVYRTHSLPLSFTSIFPNSESPRSQSLFSS